MANRLLLNRFPVLYGHGVMNDAASMISRSENSRPRRPLLGQPTIKYPDMIDSSDDYSFPFMLSNNNFDVWLFDAKGVNKDDRNISADVNFKESQKFWDFNLDDESLTDTPTMIDFVLTKTAAAKLVYCGYSESTFFLFALLSTAPEYADKVVAAVMMAPIAYTANVKGLTIPILAPLGLMIPEFIQYNFLPQPVIDTVDDSLRNLCATQSMSRLFCTPIMNGIGGKGVGQMRPDFFEKFFKSTSLKAIKHFLQLTAQKRMGMYDYGPQINMMKYKQASPPAYDLGRIRSDRIILVRGLSDFLSTPEDQNTLLSQIGTKPFKDIVIPQYNHFDFIDGSDLIKLVNAPALDAIFQLMYREGPNILMDARQASAYTSQSTNRV